MFPLLYDIDKVNTKGLIMKAEELRALQAPLKERYREQPASALQTLRVEGDLRQDKVTCIVKSPRGPIEAGLHPATGGSGKDACSGDMLLEALVGCAGVTLAAVATAMSIPIRSGTLRVAKEVDVGFKEIRLFIHLDTDAPPDQIETLIKLTKRYCVVYQTLQKT